MVVQLQNHTNLKLSSTQPQNKVSRATTFQSLKNPFFKSKVSFSGKQQPAVDWAKSDQLGQVNFSDSFQVHTNENIAKDQVVKYIETTDKTIRFKNKSHKIIAKVDIPMRSYGKSIQVGYQDNKGGFAVKLWDKKTKTAYVLFQNQNSDSIVDIPKRVSASVKPEGKPVSFTGAKQVDKKPSGIEDAIEDAIIVGMFGGFGTRLMGVSYPNTKPTTKLGANSFEVNMLRTCTNAGFRNIGASIYFGPDIVKQDVSGAQKSGMLPEDLTVTYAQQDDITGNLGTAGAVRHTVEHMLADKVAKQLKGLKAEKAEAKLKELLGEAVSSQVWKHMDASQGQFDKQLKELVVKNPRIREEIFNHQIDKVPFIGVVSGDHVTDIDMKAFAKTHVDNRALFTLALREIADYEKFEGVKSPLGHASIDEDGKILAFNEKPYWREESVPENEKGKAGVYTDDFKWLNTGVYMLSPKVLKMIPSEAQIKANKEKIGEGAKAEGSDFGKNIIPQLVAMEPLQGHCIKEHWVDVGNNIALQKELGFIVKDIHENGGTSGLLPAQEFDSTEQSAIAKTAKVGSVDHNKNSALLVSDHAKVGDIEVADVVYVGPKAVVPDGKYKNVWIDRLEKPLFSKKLNISG